jgi:hypothetical protein
MADNRNETFTVTDRRLFTPDGELRTETTENEKEEDARSLEEARSREERPSNAALAGSAEPQQDAATPLPPSAAEQKQQADAYQKSSEEMDRQVELSGHSAKDLEITFERFLASLYMTGMLQLGMMHEQGGQPQLDIIGARQTIDTISLLSEKTKGNLNSKEQNFLQNALYELRMAYVEVTNAIAKGPQPPPPGK